MDISIIDLNYRFDYFLVWGHGLSKINEIIEKIELDDNIEIKRIIYKKVKSIKKIINKIYSFDYAPLYHLKAKTRYLKKVPKEIILIFVINKNPMEVIKGQGAFKHLESERLVKIKNNIRTEFNPYINGEFTHNHIIHSSDNEYQTFKIIKDFKLSNELNNLFDIRNNILTAPSWVNWNNKMYIREVFLEDVYANIVTDNGPKFTKITETPHFRAISTQNPNIYNEYLKNNLGKNIKAYHSWKKFTALNNAFTPNDSLQNLIVVKKYRGNFIIQDGVHRASIMMFKKYNKSMVVILDD